MKKRTFIKVSALATAGSLLAPLTSCTSNENKQGEGEQASNQIKVMELPPLKFKFDALAPHIDARTMEIHHGKHHAGYVRKFNKALEGQSAYTGKSLEEMMSLIGPNDTALRNNGGGHYNHSLFWEMLTPKQTSPQGTMLSIINSAFGDLDTFKIEFKKAALSLFGSGWAWVSLDRNNKPIISSTPNQDNPLMTKVTEERPRFPLFGIDVWEHAYYLNYQNRRGDYIDSFFNVINWDAISERFMRQIKG